MIDYKTIGITSVIAMMLTTGIIYIPQVLEDKTYYYCESTPSIEPMTCDRFSSTGLRCYPTAGTTKGYKDCSTGWSTIIPEVPVIIVTPISYVGIQYTCDSEKCTRIM